MQANENFDLTVRSPGDTSVISIDNRRSLQQMRKKNIEMFAAFILQSAILPKDAKPDERESLAMAGAILKAEYGLCVVAQEAYFIPVRKEFKLDVSYKGLTKKKVEYELATGDKLIPGKGVFIEACDIERLGLNKCRKCGGSGLYYSKKCDGCSGAGMFDSKDVLLYELEYSSRNDGLAAKEIGADYFPITGSALWQPCDNVPQNRTPEWVVKKNAFKDVIRRLVPITGFGEQSSNPFNMDQPEDKSTEGIAFLADSYAVQYDDLYSLADFCRNCVVVADWKDEDEVMLALATLGLDWEIAKSDEIKYKVFGFRGGEYPIVESGALDKDEPPTGILIMNVIFDVGGREVANEISQRLFEKPCSVNALTRAQLKQIHESVVVVDG